MGGKIGRQRLELHLWSLLNGSDSSERRRVRQMRVVGSSLLWQVILRGTGRDFISEDNLFNA